MVKMNIDQKKIYALFLKRIEITSNETYDKLLNSKITRVKEVIESNGNTWRSLRFEILNLYLSNNNKSELLKLCDASFIEYSNKVDEVFRIDAVDLRHPDKLSLEEYLTKTTSNFISIKNKFPQLYISAETLNGLFWKMYLEYVNLNVNVQWQYAVYNMLFGCLTSWMHAFTMSASGLDENALTSFRRSIEFVCYISKIKESNEKGQLWLNRRKDENSAKQFSNVFSVPRCYLSENYSHLKYLLVLYDFASDFGTHANISMIAPKNEEINSEFVPIVFDEENYIPEASNTNVISGIIDYSGSYNRFEKIF